MPSTFHTCFVPILTLLTVGIEDLLLSIDDWQETNLL